VSTPSRGAARLARAAVLAVLTALVSLTGHVLAGGAIHLSGPMLLAVLALGGMAVAAAEVRRSFPEIFAVVLLAQPVFHLLASLGGHGSHASPATGMGAGMVISHVVGALVAGLLLAGAESAVWALAGLLAPWRVLATEPTSACAPLRVQPRDVAATWRPSWRPGAVLGRGPPVVACAL
jgi:hypothetical protein